jgi:hypothetical protein
MSLIEINWNPTNKQLRYFGWIALTATTLIAILLYVLKGLAVKWCAMIVIFGFSIFICSLLSKTLTRLVYLGLTLLTFPIGMTMSFVLMLVFYYLVITPVGLFFRLIGRDLMELKFDTSAKSYWKPRRPVDNNRRYFNQF